MKNSRTPRKGSSGIGRLALQIIPYILMAVFALCVLNCRIIVTSGTSMEPTYAHGDVLLCFRTKATPKAGTPVLIQKDGTLMIKRIAYVAGDNVAGEQWYPETTSDAASLIDQTPLYWGDTVVPEGYVFVKGDNSADSYDSRYETFGLVPTENIWGIVLFEF